MRLNVIARQPNTQKRTYHSSALREGFHSLWLLSLAQIPAIMMIAIHILIITNSARLNHMNGLYFITFHLNNGHFIWFNLIFLRCFLGLTLVTQNFNSDNNRFIGHVFCARHTSQCIFLIFFLQQLIDSIQEKTWCTHQLDIRFYPDSRHGILFSLP